MFSVNEQAMKIVKQIIVEQELLNVGVNELNNGSTVIDLGVNYPGGWAAAKHLVEITLGGLGTAELSYKEIEGLILPQVSIHVDHPVVACISCQLSGWALEEAKNDAGIVPLISGPVRTVAKKDDFAQVHSYHDRHDTVVAVLQDMQVPNEKLTSYLAQECNVKTENVYVLVAPTGSLAGFINVASRTLETSIWRLYQLGFDINKIVSAWGSAPVPPLTKDEFNAMARINTFTYYGGKAVFVVECQDEDIKAVLDQVILSPKTTPLYGIPFAKLLQDADGDIFKMKDFVHSVAKVTFYNALTGNSFQQGTIDSSLLMKCL